MESKIISGLMLALVAGLVVTPALARATKLSEFPGFLAKVENGVSTPNYYIVVGDNAAPIDVVGAIDVASTLASALSYQEKSVPGVTTTEVNGLEKEVPVNVNEVIGSNTYQLPSILKNFHFDGLKDSTFTYRGDEYSFHEEVELDNAQIVQTHDVNENEVNGTEKLKIGTNNPIIYKYVFDEDLNYNPSYDYPLTVYLMGKEFDLVGVDTNGIKVLSGTVGMADTETPVDYKTYHVYVIDGDSGNWAKIKITDSSGTTLYTDILNMGETKTYTLGSEQVKVKLINVWASSITSTVSAKLAVGTDVEKTYPECASIGYSDEEKYPGEDYWYVCFNDADGSGNITANDAIEVIYHPEDTVYYKAGEVFKAPNDYFEFGFLGFNTDKFSIITIEKVTDKTLYDQAGNKVASDLNGFEITADKKGTIDGTYDKVYVLFDTLGNNKIYKAFWNSKTSKIEKISDVAYPTDGSEASVTLTLNYGGSGEVTYKLKIGVTNSSGTYTLSFELEDSSDNTVATFAYTFKTAPSSSSAPDFKLGTNENDADSDDIKLGGTINIGDKENDIVTDSGAIILAPKTYTDNDKVAFKIPATTLKTKIVFGKLGSTVSTGGTYKEAVTITSPVAKLASEVNTATLDKDLILVGGPCANPLVQQLVDDGKLDETYTCAGGTPGEAWKPNTAYIIVVDDAFNGHRAMVVAGTMGTDTRVACSALQNYDTYLSGIESNAVKIDTTVAASPVVTAL